MIYQSSVITEYLDETYSQIPLMPQDPVDRMQIRLWTYWCDNLFKRDLDLFKYKRPSLNEEENLNLLSRLHTHFSKWDHALQANNFLITNRLTLADIHPFPFARQFFTIKDASCFVERYEKIQEWLHAMVSRPSFVKTMLKSL